MDEHSSDVQDGWITIVKEGVILSCLQQHTGHMQLLLYAGYASCAIYNALQGEKMHSTLNLQFHGSAALRIKEWQKTLKSSKTGFVVGCGRNTVTWTGSRKDWEGGGINTSYLLVLYFVSPKQWILLKLNILESSFCVSCCTQKTKKYQNAQKTCHS